MLDLAETLNPLLDQRKQRFEDGYDDGDDEDEDVADTTLQLVFFDGEEAFKDWTDADSVYGARLVILSRTVSELKQWHTSVQTSCKQMVNNLYST